MDAERPSVGPEADCVGSFVSCSIVSIKGNTPLRADLRSVEKLTLNVFFSNTVDSLWD